MKKIILACAAILFGLGLALAHGPSSGENPQKVIQDASQTLMKSLKANKAAIDNNPQAELFKIVKKQIYPYLDLDAMVKMTLGRQGGMQWAKASSAEKSEFKDQFMQLVVGTYAAALKEYDDQKVEVYPVRGFNNSMKEAEVHSKIYPKSGSPINIEYDMIKENDKWYAQDFTVEGISLVNSYQAQFQSIIQDKGLKGLIETLKKHNKANSK